MFAYSFLVERNDAAVTVVCRDLPHQFFQMPDRAHFIMRMRILREPARLLPSSIVLLSFSPGPKILFEGAIFHLESG